MKTFKYNINGHDYEVSVEGIENYVATVVSAYRRALDAIKNDPSLMAPGAPLTRDLTQELNKCSHRIIDAFKGVKAGGADAFISFTVGAGICSEFKTPPFVYKWLFRLKSVKSIFSNDAHRE